MQWFSPILIFVKDVEHLLDFLLIVSPIKHLLRGFNWRRKKATTLDISIEWKSKNPNSYEHFPISHHAEELVKVYGSTVVIINLTQKNDQYKNYKKKKTTSATMASSSFSVILSPTLASTVPNSWNESQKFSKITFMSEKIT